jgi:AraC-like DNA-binding protein
MAQQGQDKTIDAAVELLLANGFDGLAEAVTVLMNYSKLQLDFVHFTVNAAADDEVVLSSHIDVPRRPSRHVIEHMFANIMKLANSQVGYQAIRQRIEFMHEDAGNPRHVERVLNASVTFGCGSDLIFVPAQFFKQQSRYGQEDLFPVTEELARQRLMELRGEDKLINATRETILKQLPSGLPKIGDTAQALGMSARTLQRRLQERRLKYQTLLDEVRRELARQLIIKPELSLSEVADYLGFNDQSAFQHAFQRWEGTTPGRFREPLHTGRHSVRAKTP